MRMEEMSNLKPIRSNHLLLWTKKLRPRVVRRLAGGYTALSSGSWLQESGLELFP